MQRINHKTSGLVSWFINNPVASNLLMLFTLILGVHSISGVGVSPMQSAPPTSISISLPYNTTTPLAAQKKYTFALEEILKDLPEISDFYTETGKDTLNATIIVNHDSNIELLHTQLISRVQESDFFRSSQFRPKISINERSNLALQIEVQGSQYLPAIADHIASNLRKSKSIYSVKIQNDVRKNLHIDFDPSRLRKYDLSIDDVVEKIRSRINSNSFSSSSSSITLNDIAQIEPNIEQLKNLPVKMLNAGKAITVDDLATITLKHDQNYRQTKFNGDDTVSIFVYSDDNDNIIKTSEAARSISNDIVKQYAYQGIKISYWNDGSTFIQKRLEVLFASAFYSFLIVFILLYLLVDFPTALWAALGLPFTLFGALFVLQIPVINSNINELTIFGFIMALGMVVDDSVIVGESIKASYKLHGRSQRSTLIGTLSVSKAITYGAMTTIATFSMLSGIDGFIGQMYLQFAGVVSICLMLSLIESQLILPAHIQSTNELNWLPKRMQRWLQVPHDTSLRILSSLNAAYCLFLRRAITHRYSVIILSVSFFLMILSFPISGKIRTVFFPEIPSSVVSASIKMMDGSQSALLARNLDELLALAMKADKTLTTDEISGIKNIRISTMGVEDGVITIELTENAPYDLNSFVRAWRKLVHPLEGSKSIEIRDKISVVYQYNIDILGDFEKEQKLAKEYALEWLANIKGINSISELYSSLQPEIAFRLRPLGSSLGISTEQLAKQLAQILQEQIISTYIKDGAQYNLTLGLNYDQKNIYDQLAEATIKTQDGSYISILSVSDVEFRYTEKSIYRENARSIYKINVDLNKGMLSAAELTDLINSELVPELSSRFPGVEIQLSGEEKEKNKAESSLRKTFLISVLLIFILLAIPLKSYSAPLIIISVIPYGIAGALIGHWIHGTPLSIMSFSGIIAMAGVVINDSLLIILRFNDDYFGGEADKSITEAIVDACSSRFNAVLITSITTYFGLLPIILDESPFTKTFAPAAISLAYGVACTTVITLILLPSLLLILNDIKGRFGKGLKTYIREDQVGV